MPSDEEWKQLHHKYLDSTLTIPGLAKDSGISARSIRWNFKRLSLTLKDSSRTRSEAWLKTKETLLSKYGVSNFTKTAEYTQKAKATNLRRYGTEFAAQSNEVKQKIKTAQNRNHGMHPSKLPEVREKIRRSLLDSDVVEKAANLGFILLEPYTGITNRETLEGKRTGQQKVYLIKHQCGKQFSSTLLRLPRCPKCQPRSESALQCLYKEYLSGLNVQVISNYRELRNRQGNIFEIDLYLPEYNMGIEVNSLYYHAYREAGVSRKYHVDKTENCLQHGIDLIHIWEHLNPDLVKSKLNHLVGRSKSVRGSRSVALVGRAEANAFFTQNHLHGSATFSSCLGLYIKGRLLAALALNRNEIARFAVLNGNNVPGAFQQLLSKIDLDEIVTFVDRDFSPNPDKTVYAKAGFQLEGWSEHFFYTNFKETFARQKFQRHKIAMNEEFDPSLSAAKNLAKQGIFPCYTSGNWKFRLRR